MTREAVGCGAPFGTSAYGTMQCCDHAPVATQRRPMASFACVPARAAREGVKGCGKHLMLVGVGALEFHDARPWRVASTCKIVGTGLGSCRPARADRQTDMRWGNDARV